MLSGVPCGFNPHVRILALALLLVGICNPAQSLPKFADFAVKTIFHGVPAQPRFTRRGQNSFPDADERYRESVEFDAREGPNFAGGYTIARWSCGTECSSMVVVDARTGTIYRDAPFGTLDTSRHMKTDGPKYAGLSFRKDSSLLIVEGCFDADFREANGKRPDCSRSYYQWVAPRFKLLLKLPVTHTQERR